MQFVRIAFDMHTSLLKLGFFLGGRVQKNQLQRKKKSIYTYLTFTLNILIYELLYIDKKFLNKIKYKKYVDFFMQGHIHMIQCIIFLLLQNDLFLIIFLPVKMTLQQLKIIVSMCFLHIFQNYILLHRTSTVDVDSKGHPCKERMMTILCDVSLSDGHTR